LNYWLIKSEPSEYSWQDLVKDKRAKWRGVRNRQAVNYLRAMRIEDRCFFYHSNVGLEIVGIAKVTKAAYPDSMDKTKVFVVVGIEPDIPLPELVTLEQIKQHPQLAQLGLVRQPRLSVMPIDPVSWEIICGLGGLKSSK